MPHGPWKSLLIGKYEGRDLSLYQNPQRDLLYVVVDRDQGGKAKGLVVTVYRGFFLERGDLKVLIEHITGSPVGVSKKWKGELFQFLLITAGIKYIGLDPKELAQTVDEMVVTLNRMEKNVLLLSKTIGMYLKPLAMVPRNVAAILFTEPSVIAGLSPVSAVTESSEGIMILGTTKGGDVVRESAENFRRTVIYGNQLGRKRMFIVLLEEFLRNGINAMVVTRNPANYEGLKMAGTHNLELKKLGLRPLGLSTETVEDFIDLAIVPPKTFVGIAGINLESDTAGKIEELLRTYGIEAERPSGIAARIEGTDMISLRAGRVLTAVDLTTGERFKRMTYNRFIQLSSTGLGTAFLLKLSDPWSYLSLLSYLKGIGESLKRTGRSESIRFAVFIEEAERLLTNTDNIVTEALASILDEYKDYGLGWVLETEKDTELNNMVLAMTETKVGAVGPDDLAVRTLVKRPYRMEPRPFLTTTELSGAPLISSLQARQPGHT